MAKNMFGSKKNDKMAMFAVMILIAVYIVYYVMEHTTMFQFNVLEGNCQDDPDKPECSN